MAAAQPPAASEASSWAIRGEALQTARRAVLTLDLPAVQPLLGHTKIESTVRYLGIEVDDAVAMAEQVDV